MTTPDDLRIAAHRELLAETARKLGEIRFQATGDSMLPSVWPGDRLTIRRQNFSELQPGQIVLYVRRDGQFVAHRILRNDQGRLITRGDSLRQDDSPVHEDQILGRVVSASRNGRSIRLDLTPGRRAVAWMLRKSDLLERLFLRFTRVGRMLAWPAMLAKDGN